MKFKSLSLAGAILLSLAAQVLGQGSSFYFTSSPQSVVGQGESWSVDTTNGGAFTASVDANNVVSLLISFGTRSWTLNFAAPNNGPLAVGAYDNAQLWPTQAPDRPGMAFATPGAVPASIIGYFSVLNLQIGPGNVVEVFDADFLQYDNDQFSNFNFGGVRFAAAAPVPEPGVATLAVAGLLALFFSQKLLRQRH